MEYQEVSRKLLGVSGGSKRFQEASVGLRGVSGAQERFNASQGVAE